MTHHSAQSKATKQPCAARLAPLREVLFSISKKGAGSVDEALSKREAARAARLAPLRKVLVFVSKKGAGVDKALSELEAAINDYRVCAYPIRDGAGQRTKFTVAETRKELATLDKTLRAALDAFEGMSLPARSLLADQIENPKQVWAELIRHLGCTTDAVPRALHVAKKQPNREPNHFRKVLALRVALVMRDILGVRPTSTRHTHGYIRGTRGGGKYSRVLEQVFTLADGHSTDLEKLIAAGLKLLKDPDLPHNLPRESPPFPPAFPVGFDGDTRTARGARWRIPLNEGQRHGRQDQNTGNGFAECAPSFRLPSRLGARSPASSDGALRLQCSDRLEARQGRHPAEADQAVEAPYDVERR
jgi:hypothetical protein